MQDLCFILVPARSEKDTNKPSSRESDNLLDRTTKENFDLKLKIGFLEDALLQQSDEGIELIIGENAHLRK